MGMAWYGMVWDALDVGIVGCTGMGLCRHAFNLRHFCNMESVDEQLTMGDNVGNIVAVAASATTPTTTTRAAKQEDGQPAADAFGGICAGLKLLWHCSCGII